MKMKLTRSQRIGLIGLCPLIIAILIAFAIVPSIKTFVTKRKLSLRKGTLMRGIWTKYPFITEAHMYLFNVTNHLEIAEGAKPIVKEVGPFVYDVHQEKVEQIDHEEDDTVSYIPRNYFYFNKYKSNGLNDEMQLILPHFFIFTCSNNPLKDKPALVSYASRGVDVILNKPESAFAKVKAKVALFDGFRISCAGIEDYFGKIICNEIRDRYFDYTLRKDGDIYYTSLFGFINGTYYKENRLRIGRGFKNLKDLGKLVGYGDHDNLATWEDEKCDELEGTDGSIFPPFMNEKGKDQIKLVHTVTARKLTLTYHSKVKFAGLKLLRYMTDVGTDGDHVPEEKCYCINPDSCLKKGMFELFRPLNIPLLMSNPHFFMADPYYLTTVDTLTPDKDKHMFWIDFDALTGIPIRAHVRVQFNFELQQIEKFRLMRNFTYAMLPVAWIDHVTVLPDFLIKMIRSGHFLLKLADVIVYILVSVGLALCFVAGYLEYKSRKVDRLNLKPTKLSETASANSDSIESRINHLHAAPVPVNLD